ncbi:MAG: glucose-6-phosphate isomerase [Spirochaetaceae bacterium]|jgi:glucose-6-phosphate isomerase|nr:glucose-6-phosphate isomerase [Spirochaetaceae bacterium]
MDFDQTKAYETLRTLSVGRESFDFSELDAKRVESFTVTMAAGLCYSYAAAPVDEAVLAALQDSADEQQLINKYRAVLCGQIMNTGENRKVLHHLTRGQVAEPVIHNGRDQRAFYLSQQERIAAFVKSVHNGTICGSTGKPFTTAVQIGIGGSDLGPRALYLALEGWATTVGRKRMNGYFISNVDPDDGTQVLSALPLEQTLFILVSKSGTTQETLANELLVKSSLQRAGLDPAKHVVAVTSETSPLANNKAYLDSFYIDDFIGGRYSSTSSVGAVILSLAYGSMTFTELLAGAHEADRLALEPSIQKNAALLDALIGVWERNFLNYAATAILPYSQALSRFPAHLQQLDMESNGKRVNKDGHLVSYKTGPIVFGEPGTNGQHSFYQLLHQGTDIVPLQFIGFSKNQRGDDIMVEDSTNQTKLLANLAAQIVAFAKGQPVSGANRTKEFPGARPSTLIYGKTLNPASLGALLSHFENKVMFQGFVWNINSFDQEGVQLGKILTKKVLSGQSGDTALDAYSKLLGIE